MIWRHLVVRRQTAGTKPVVVAPLVLLNLRLSGCLCLFPGDDDDDVED